MSDLARTDDLFFGKTGMDRGQVERAVAEALSGMDDGELFLEYCQSESLVLDDGKIKSASFDTAQGFGLRALSGEAAGYAHASELNEAAIRRAGQTVRAVKEGHSGTLAAPPPGTNRQAFSGFELSQISLGDPRIAGEHFSCHAAPRSRFADALPQLSKVMRWRCVFGALCSHSRVRRPRYPRRHRPILLSMEDAISCTCEKFNAVNFLERGGKICKGSWIWRKTAGSVRA